jgi:hypothetical protein
MGVKNSSDDFVDAIDAMEDEVQSLEVVTSMNVLEMRSNDDNNQPCVVKRKS